MASRLYRINSYSCEYVSIEVEHPGNFHDRAVVVDLSDHQAFEDRPVTEDVRLRLGEREKRRKFGRV